MDMDQAIQCALRYRKIGDKIASVTLRRESGKVLQTGGMFDSHYTWWLPRDVDVSDFAQVVRTLQ